jgi:mono/diheme cytochrome c family protein
MIKLLLALLAAVSLIQAKELNTQMQEFMNALKIEAKKQNPDFKEFSYASGEKIFTTEHIGKKGKLISCASCHTSELSNKGMNEHTNKVIEPLSPSTNSERFTDIKNVKKWLRRNFNDVYTREGSAEEKGDVITYIINKG